MRSTAMVIGAISLTLGAAPLKDAELQAYFAGEVEKIEATGLAGIRSRADWEKQRPELRRQLFEMLGLDPLPQKTELKAVVTGRVEREEFIVEKLHFQSLPGLYVTANFYLPKQIEKPLPTILYVCGHALVKTNGISYGNKAGYQHHGAWFARNGYACLTIDTIQLGEIEGIHHGTHREGMWWWNSRGYTPAGVEAWNGIRALDYLETRPEVDKTRFGVTGRSGGGAYSWWIAALDDRIQAAAPVAGITDLRNHVIDGVVEGHCDCMYFVNTYRWDYPVVAALVAPRPLLLANSDKDSIFPLDGVYRTHAKIAPIYQLYNASTHLGLLVTEGPHKDTQDLQLPVFRWFNRHLKKEDPIIEMAATRFFSPSELKVFESLPEDQIVTRIHETFVPEASPEHTKGSARRQELTRLLRAKVFHGWPEEPPPLRAETHELENGWKVIQFDSQAGVRLKLFVLETDRSDPGARLFVTSEEPTVEDLDRSEWARAILVVRGGSDMNPRDRTNVQIRRRYMLVGQTLDGMRVWDILRGLEALRSAGLNPVAALGDGRQAGNLLMAAFLNLESAPYVYLDHVAAPGDQPDYLNFLRFTSLDEIQDYVMNLQN